VAEYIGVYPSQARTATPTAAELVNDRRLRFEGLVVVIDCTAATSSPSVVFTIQGYDQASGKAYTILASSAITGTGTTVLRVHPDLTASANAIAKDVIPAHFKITAVHGNSDSITYSVGASLI